LKQIGLTLESADGKVLLKQFSAHDAQDGTVSGTGSILLDADAKYPFDMQINTNKTHFLHLDYADVVADGELTFKGNLDGATVGGVLTITDARLDIPKEIPVNVERLPVRYVNEDCPTATPTTSERIKLWPIALDLIIKAPQDMHMTGRGLTAEWVGEVAVSGTAQAPLLYGDLRMAKGDFSFSEKSFEIVQGRLSFAGDPKTKTTIDIMGEYQQDEYKITAMFKGPIQDPKLSFYSNPALPEKEILSLILFNKHMAEITPMEGVQLAQTLVSLRGGDSGPNMLGKIGRSVGLDKLDVGTLAQGGTNHLTLQAGKYISQGVLVTVSRGLTTQTNKFAIEANLTRQFKIQAETGDPIVGSKASIKWKRDY
jgi:translocation and assembly module TamB